MITTLILFVSSALTVHAADSVAEIQKRVHAPEKPIPKMVQHNLPKVARPNPLEEAPIRKNTVVDVESYNAVNNTYSLVITAEPGAGPNIAAAEDLAKAVSTLDPQDIKARPAKLVGNQYKLDTDLRMLSERGQRQREKMLKK